MIWNILKFYGRVILVQSFAFRLIIIQFKPQYSVNFDEFAYDISLFALLAYLNYYILRAKKFFSVFLFPKTK